MKKVIQISFSAYVAILVFGCEAEKFSPTSTPDKKEIIISTEKSAAVPSYDHFDFIGKVNNEAVKLALESPAYSGYLIMVNKVFL